MYLELFGEQLRYDLNAPRVGPLSNTAKPTGVYLFYRLYPSTGVIVQCRTK